MKDSTPPPLPPRAPRGLRDFVACRADEVVLDPSDLGWLPKPLPWIPEALMPSAEVIPGELNHVRLKVRWAVLFRLRLDASVIDGRLRVDGGGPLHGPIGHWVDDLNAHLGECRPLDTLEVLDGKVVVRKRSR